MKLSHSSDIFPYGILSAKEESKGNGDEIIFSIGTSDGSTKMIEASKGENNTLKTKQM